MIIEAAETIATLVAAGFAAHKVENALIRGGILKSPLEDEMSSQPKAPPARPVSLDEALAESDLVWERHEARLFLANPLAWWLDPNRWGDNPNWREMLLAEKPVKHPIANFDSGKIVEPHRYYCPCGKGRVHRVNEHEAEMERREALAAPPCPNCKIGRRTVMGTHDGVATLWDCVDCGAEFTRKGETASSKKRRQAKAKLPCGCTGDIIQISDKGFLQSNCRTCEARWYSRSNDPSGRTLAKGEKVYHANPVFNLPLDNDEPLNLPPPPRVGTRNSDD